jgi:hypothetical protein
MLLCMHSSSRQFYSDALICPYSEQTFLCVRDILDIIKIHGARKNGLFFRPGKLLDDIASKRGDLQYCLQMV